MRFLQSFAKLEMIIDVILELLEGNVTKANGAIANPPST